MQEPTDWRTTPQEAAEARGGMPWFLKLFLFLLTVATIAAGVYYLPIFKVQSITVVGNSYVPMEDVCRVSGIRHGMHLLQVETDKASRTLVKDLRISQANVRRVFPNGIMIEIEERHPVAAIACEYGYLDLDGVGMVLGAHKTRTQIGTPFLAGVSVEDYYIGDCVENKLVRDALTYLAGFDTIELAQLKELRLDKEDKVIGCTVNGVEIRIGKLERFDEKIVTTKHFLSDLRTKEQPVEFLSMEFAQAFIKFRK